MGFFSAIGDIFDKVTDIGAAVAPAVAVVNPGIAGILQGAQAIDEQVNRDDPAQDGIAFENIMAAVNTAEQVYGGIILGDAYDQQQEGDAYLDEIMSEIGAS